MKPKVSGIIPLCSAPLHAPLDSRLSTPLPLTHRIWREIVRFICLKHLKDGHKFNLNDSKVADFVFLEVVVDHVDS